MTQPAGLWAKLDGSLLRSLRQPNYRRYFLGQGVSVMGTWMQTVALSWLVYRLTGSAAWIGSIVTDKQGLPNATRLVAPPVASALLGLTSQALCFALNAISYLAIAQALRGMQLASLSAVRSGSRAGFGEGLRFARGSAPVQQLIGLAWCLARRGVHYQSLALEH